ncbi:MAG: hypothetical protein ACF8SC_00570 [Phycisphaerales bacterium JB037]
MQAFLDDVALDLERPTMLAAFQAAIESASESGRVIVEASGDGAPLPDEYLGEPPDDSAGFAELRFISAEPIAMVRSVLGDAIEALDQAAADQQAAAEFIQSGKLEAGREALERVTALWQAVLVAVQRGAQLINLDLMEVSLGEPPTPLIDEIEMLGGALRGLIEQFTNEDWSAVADTLEIDLAELADRWKGLLGELSARLAG